MLQLYTTTAAPPVIILQWLRDTIDLLMLISNFINYFYLSTNPSIFSARFQLHSLTMLALTQAGFHAGTQSQKHTNYFVSVKMNCMSDFWMTGIRRNKCTILSAVLIRVRTAPNLVVDWPNQTAAAGRVLTWCTVASTINGQSQKQCTWPSPLVLLQQK